jgi:microcystin-dependent protein
MPAEYIQAALLTIGVQNDGRDHIALMPSGNVGVGTTMPVSKLDVKGSLSCSSISGPANLIQKAHFSLKGGGTITWSKANRLTWNRRFIAIGFGITDSSSEGYFNILGPTMPGFGGLESWDGSNRIQDASVELRDWESLYAIMTGIGPNDVRLRIENYQQQGELSSNWLLIASRNGDDGTLKLGIGPSVSPGQSISYGSPIPCGTIVMWSGKPEDIPVGWFICDGSNGTPDLRGRFILGSGKGSGLTLRDLKQPMGGREAIALGTNELPKHRHGITDPKHSHTWWLSRQLQGIDDQNYTSELSKGDAGPQDSLQVGTTSVGTGIEINDAGAGAAFDIMPPFYILIFIMKGFVS